jgi:phospholipase/carboxylesterase
MTISADLGFEHLLEPGTDGTTLLLLHATGGDERQLVPLGRRLAPEATLLSPRGKVLEDGATRRFFARRGVFELDIPDLLARTDELADFVAAASDAYGLGRVIALGYSNGANIAASLLLRRPEVLAGAALLRPTLPYEPDSPPAVDGIDVLIAAGSRDPYVEPGKAERLADVLRAGGARVTYGSTATGHGLTDADLAATGEWLAEARGVTATDPDRCAYVVGEDGLARLHGSHAQAWIGLQRAHRELTRRLESVLAERHGLSLTALELLGRLAAAEQRRQRLSRLAEEVGLSLSRVSRVVDALERRGLVQRQPCPEDSRATNAWLTDAGLALVRDAQAEHVAAVQRSFFDRLDAGELRVLADVFNRLTQEQT